MRDCDQRRYSREGIRLEYGVGAILRVPRLVAEADARRVVLVCGRRSFEASGAVAMLPALEQVADVQRWSEFAPNPDVTDLQQGLEVVREYRADLVLGVGGGSAMDIAKLLCAYAEGPTELALLDDIRGGRRIEHRRPKLILAPTTSGSGSEATHFAVVYIGHDKFSVAGPAVRADTIVLDPQLSLSGSAYQRAASGIDAVCQAIESLWATGATPHSRRLARHGLRFLLPCIEPFVKHPTLEVASAMCLGSHLAGRAIDVSKTTAAHALSYGITKQHGVSHGHAVALTLGPFIEAHADAEPSDLHPAVDPSTHYEAMAEILARLSASNGTEAHERFLELVQRVGLFTRLTAAGIVRPEQRTALAAAVNTERLGNNPVLFDAAGLRAVLERAS